MRLGYFAEGGLTQAASDAGHVESLGFDTYWIGERGHDPFVQAAGATLRTESIHIGTSIAVAFARTPMTVAHQAWDLADSSGGRFILGLGTQVKAHITRRYSMPWSAPAARMREFVTALREIFSVFQNGGQLQHDGECYQHTLLTPFFNPGPIENPDIPIAIAAVGPEMTRLAGELCDGVFLHPFTNAAYQDAVTFPRLEEGLRDSGRSRDALWAFTYLFLIVGDDDETREREAEQVRRAIAFYASTPNYRPVLEAIDHGGIQGELHHLAKSHRWDEMAELIDDSILSQFALEGTLEELAPLIRRRFDGRCDHVAPYFPIPEEDPDRLRDFVAAVHSA